MANSVVRRHDIGALEDISRERTGNVAEIYQDFLSLGQYDIGEELLVQDL